MLSKRRFFSKVKKFFKLMKKINMKKTDLEIERFIDDNKERFKNMINTSNLHELNEALDEIMKDEESGKLAQYSKRTFLFVCLMLVYSL